MINAGDKNIIRELAKTHMELASLDINKERIKRIRDMNGLNPVRPPVWIYEIPWHEMDVEGQLSLKCEGEKAREIEQFFRRSQFQWRYFQADMVMEDTYYIMKSFNYIGHGVDVEEETITLDEKNTVISHHYKDQLDTDEKVESLVMPTITVNLEADRRNLEFYQDIFHDMIPVKLRGYYVGHGPWDEISWLRGVEPALIDIMDRPEFVHRLVEKLMQIGISKFTQMEEQGLLDYNIHDLHCTPPYTDELPAPDYDGGSIRLKDVWCHAYAQMFSTVSPDMHEEFDIQYNRKLMEKCGLVYYGCCEPLDNKISLLKKIPNLRKIGVSPWANVRICAEQIGGDYVLARKPNPSYIVDGFNPETVKNEIKETIEICLENKCPYEFVLKDISTVSYKPQNLFEWNRVVQETIDRYY